MPDDKSAPLGYFRLVARATMRHAISRASFIIAIISVITGAALWLAPNFGMIIDAAGLETMLRSPKFYTAIVVSVILFNLIFAQYRIWRGDQKTIAALRNGHDEERQRRNKNIAKLQEFYVVVAPIITRSLPKDISEDDFNKYVEEANAWAMNCATWIDENMGEPAQARFLDRTNMLSAFVRGAVK